MFIHNECGGEVQVRANVIEYATLQGFDAQGEPIMGELMVSDVQYVQLYCEECELVVNRRKVINNEE
jgi:hypothetical protein